MALVTVGDYLRQARNLLQDTYAGAYRYSDDELVDALNNAVIEMQKLRPDLFTETTPSPYSSASTGTAVEVPALYAMPPLYYMVGAVQLRDDENTQDARASGFMQKFTAQLITGAA